MLFCENCNIVTEEKICPCCGRKKLREVTGEDFCYFTKMNVFDFEMLEYTLKENGIEVVGVPFNTYGATYSTAGRADGRRVYVRYKDMEKAKDIFNTLFDFGK